MLRSRIDYILLDKRMKVGALIEATNLAKQTVLRARKDETLPSCKLETLEKIADVLGVRICDLFEQV